MTQVKTLGFGDGGSNIAGLDLMIHAAGPIGTTFGDPA
jgi:hypothetical protein